MKTRQQQRSIVAVAILLFAVSIGYFVYLSFVKRSNKVALEITTTSVKTYNVPSFSLQNIFGGIQFDQPTQTVPTQPAGPVATTPQGIQLVNSLSDQSPVKDQTISKSETTQQENSTSNTQSPSVTSAVQNQSVATTTKPVVTSSKRSTSTIEETPMTPLTESPTTTEGPAIVTDIWITPFGEAGVPIGSPVVEPLNVSGIDPIAAVTWEILDSNVSGASISSNGVLSFTSFTPQSISITVRATADGSRITTRGGSYYSFDPAPLVNASPVRQTKRR